MTEQEFVDYIKDMRQACKNEIHCDECDYYDKYCQCKGIDAQRLYRECVEWNEAKKRKNSPQT